MDNSTLKVPMTLFAKNRQRLCARLEKLSKPADNWYVFLEGGIEVPFYDTDIAYNVFRQEPFFFWAFGVEITDCVGLIEVKTGNAYLFVTRCPDEYTIWMGAQPPLSKYTEIYGIENVNYCDQLDQFLKDLGNSATLLTLKGVNSDSRLQTPPIRFKNISSYRLNNDILYNEISECRVIKTPEEIEVLRYVTRISSEAHKRVMRYVRPNMTEYQCESHFRDYCYKEGGCRHVAYTCICCSGYAGAILHYGHEAAPNKKKILDGDMCLFDMGGNYCGYSADITCSFPANGVFTEDQKLIYNAVLAASRAVITAAKPGQNWVAMHKLANRVLLTYLKQIGILTGDVDTMMESQIAAFFQPHGLGHLIGLDVHDVGGYLSKCPERPKERSLKNLRTARDLEEGMVLTIEPGCYFIDVLLDELLNSPELKLFVDNTILKRFRGFGGVRIEDDVLITKDGCEVLSIVPRTIEEIEKFMATRSEYINIKQA